MAASSSRVEAQAAEIAQLRAQLMEQLEGHRQLLQQMTVAQAQQQQQQQQQPQDQHEQTQLLLQQQPPSTVGAGAAAPAPTWTLNALGLPAELPISRKRAAEPMDSAEALMQEATALVKEADEDGGGDGEGGKWARRTRLLSTLVMNAGSHAAAAAAADSRARAVARKLWAGKQLPYV